MGRCGELVVVRGNELLRWCHAAHGKRTWNVRDRGGNVHVGEILVARFGRFLFERVEVFILTLEIFLIEVERLAVLAGLMGAAMSRNSMLVHCFK